VTQRIFNVRPSPPDEIDREERATFTVERAALDIPSGRTVVGMIPPRTDQGSLGTCIAHMSYVLYSHKFKEKYGRFPAIGIPEINAFYDLCVKVEGGYDPERTGGLWPVTAFRVMRGSGFPLAGGKRGPHITGFEYVGSTYADVRRSIVTFNDPVGVALSWDSAWMVCPTNKVLRPPVGQIIGGHGFAAFVRDDAYAGVGEVEGNVQSWGKWGPNGTFYLRDDYLLDRWVEGWRIKGIE